MKRYMALLIALALTGCSTAPQDDPLERSPAPVVVNPPAEKPPADPDPRPDLLWRSPRTLSRDEVQAGLLRLINQPGATPEEQLKRLFPEHLDLPQYGEGASPWIEADLNGDGQAEIILALPISDRADYQERSAALFVIYRQDGAYQVDRSDRMHDWAEVRLIEPWLHGVADLTGSGRPQIFWSRPQLIATGPRPVSFFVTEWAPGTLTHLPGEMVITREKSSGVTIEGREIVLTGGSRGAQETGLRMDRYRFLDGAFRLVDRRFFEPEPKMDSYARFWDGLAAEAVGRLADAKADYRAAMEPDRQPFPSLVYRYMAPPLELNAAEMARFGEALRAFAQFRLGLLLIGTEEAAGLERSGPYAGLTDALQGAQTREAACQAAAAWGAATPAFFEAITVGLSFTSWTPELLCSQINIDDHLAL